MDKKSLIQFALTCIAFFLIWSFFIKPSDAEIESRRIEAARLDSIAQANAPKVNDQLGTKEITQTAENQTSNSEPQTELPADMNALVTPEEDAKDVVISNNVWDLTINTKGGMPSKVKLTDGYVAYADSAPIQLWDPEMSSMSIEFTHKGKTMNTRNLMFTPSASSLTVADSSRISFTSALDGGGDISIIYDVVLDRYDASIQVVLNNAGDVGSKVLYDWSTAALHQEKGIYNEQLHSSVFFKTFEDGRDYLGESREDSETVNERLNWVAHKQNYFSVLAISKNGFDNGGYLKSYPDDLATDTVHSTYYESRLPLINNHPGNGAYSFKLFMGPNDLEVLKSLNTPEVVKIPDYGWTIFGWVNRTLIAPFFNWLNNFGLSAGLLIFILTFVVKLILSPVQWKNYMNSAKMKAIRPEIDELNKKFENKPPIEKQQATMALYKQCGVNPMAGCLPALLQMPLLYAMFRFFPANIDLRQKGFLWADDLGSYDSIMDLPIDIPFYGAHISGFTVLMAISMFFYTRMSAGNMPAQTQPGMPNMKAIMNIFPVMMLVFFNKFAAGLSLYYFLANLFSIGQMWFIKKFLINEESIREKIEENKKKPAKKKSAFAQRLEDMQKEQQKKLKQPKKKK